MNRQLAPSEGDTLFRDHSAAAFRVAISVLKNHVEADDLVGNLFLAFHRHGVPETYTGGARAYILFVTRMRAIDRLRELKRHLAVEVPFEASTIVETVEPIDQTSEVHLLLDEIESAMNREFAIERRARNHEVEAVYHHIREGKTFKELAAEWDVSPSTVAIWSYKGLQFLRKAAANRGLLAQID